NAAFRRKSRSRDTAEHRVREALQRQLFDHLPVAVYICEASGLIVYFNDQAEKLWAPNLNDRYDRFCGSYRMYSLDGHPIPHAECPMAEVLRTGIPVSEREIVIERLDGSRGVALVNINPLKDATGGVIGAINCFQDITEQKRSAKQITTLGQEAEHRVKNILATVQATVKLSQSDTVDGLRRAIEGRIQALANAHTVFYETRGKGAQLSVIVERELGPYLQEGQGRVRIAGPLILVDPNAAQAIAVILHELATNAAKYGALSVAEGHAEVTWSYRPDGRLVLRWEEQGSPTTTPPSHVGFGTRIIWRMIRDQLNGEMRLDWRAEGLRCEPCV